MRKMQAEMANLCSKEANPQKAKSNFEVASMLEILLKTENVYPFSPCDRDFREIFFKRIHNSPPIPTSTISIASSTRYTQSLDRVLCEIALQGNQIIRTMQAINTAIAESISDMRHTRGMIAHHATVIDEQQENIAREKRRIKKNEAIIRYYQRQGLMHYHPILDIEYVIMKLTCDLNLMREQTLFNEKYFEIKNALLAETYNSSKEISLISF